MPVFVAILCIILFICTYLIKDHNKPVVTEHLTGWQAFEQAIGIGPHSDKIGGRPPTPAEERAQWVIPAAEVASGADSEDPSKAGDVSVSAPLRTQTATLSPTAMISVNGKLVERQCIIQDDTRDFKDDKKNPFKSDCINLGPLCEDPTYGEYVSEKCQQTCGPTIYKRFKEDPTATACNNYKPYWDNDKKLSSNKEENINKKGSFCSEGYGQARPGKDDLTCPKEFPICASYKEGHQYGYCTDDKTLPATLGEKGSFAKLNNTQKENILSNTKANGETLKESAMDENTKIWKFPYSDKYYDINGILRTLTKTAPAQPSLQEKNKSLDYNWLCGEPTEARLTRQKNRHQYVPYASGVATEYCNTKLESLGGAGAYKQVLDAVATQKTKDMDEYNKAAALHEKAAHCQMRPEIIRNNPAYANKVDRAAGGPGKACNNKSKIECTKTNEIVCQWVDKPPEPGPRPNDKPLPKYEDIKDKTVMEICGGVGMSAHAGVQKCADIPYKWKTLQGKGQLEHTDPNFSMKSVPFLYKVLGPMGGGANRDGWAAGAEWSAATLKKEVTEIKAKDDVVLDTEQGKSGVSTAVKVAATGAATAGGAQSETVKGNYIGYSKYSELATLGDAGKGRVTDGKAGAGYKEWVKLANENARLAPSSPHLCEVGSESGMKAFKSLGFDVYGVLGGEEGSTTAGGVSGDTRLLSKGMQKWVRDTVDAAPESMPHRDLVQKGTALSCINGDVCNGYIYGGSEGREDALYKAKADEKKIADELSRVKARVAKRDAGDVTVTGAGEGSKGVVTHEDRKVDAYLTQVLATLTLKDATAKQATVDAQSALDDMKNDLGIYNFSGEKNLDPQLGKCGAVPNMDFIENALNQYISKINEINKTISVIGKHINTNTKTSPTDSAGSDAHTMWPVGYSLEQHDQLLQNKKGLYNNINKLIKKYLYLQKSGKATSILSADQKTRIHQKITEANEALELSHYSSDIANEKLTYSAYTNLGILNWDELLNWQPDSIQLPYEQWIAPADPPHNLAETDASFGSLEERDWGVYAGHIQQRFPACDPRLSSPGKSPGCPTSQKNGRGGETAVQPCRPWKEVRHTLSQLPGAGIDDNPWKDSDPLLKYNTLTDDTDRCNLDSGPMNLKKPEMQMCRGKSLSNFQESWEGGKELKSLMYPDNINYWPPGDESLGMWSARAATEGPPLDTLAEEAKRKAATAMLDEDKQCQKVSDATRLADDGGKSICNAQETCSFDDVEYERRVKAIGKMNKETIRKGGSWQKEKMVGDGVPGTVLTMNVNGHDEKFADGLKLTRNCEGDGYDTISMAKGADTARAHLLILEKKDAGLVTTAQMTAARDALEAVTDVGATEAAKWWQAVTTLSAGARPSTYYKSFNIGKKLLEFIREDNRHSPLKLLPPIRGCERNPDQDTDCFPPGSIPRPAKGNGLNCPRPGCKPNKAGSNDPSVHNSCRPWDKITYQCDVDFDTKKGFMERVTNSEDLVENIFEGVGETVLSGGMYLGGVEDIIQGLSQNSNFSRYPHVRDVDKWSLPKNAKTFDNSPSGGGRITLADQLTASHKAYVSAAKARYKATLAKSAVAQANKYKKQVRESQIKADEALQLLWVEYTKTYNYNRELLEEEYMAKDDYKHLQSADTPARIKARRAARRKDFLKQLTEMDILAGKGKWPEGGNYLPATDIKDPSYDGIYYEPTVGEGMEGLRDESMGLTYGTSSGQRDKWNSVNQGATSYNFMDSPVLSTYYRGIGLQNFHKAGSGYSDILTARNAKNIPSADDYPNSTCSPVVYERGTNNNITTDIGSGCPMAYLSLLGGGGMIPPNRQSLQISAWAHDPSNGEPGTTNVDRESWFNDTYIHKEAADDPTTNFVKQFYDNNGNPIISPLYTGIDYKKLTGLVSGGGADGHVTKTKPPTNKDTDVATGKSFIKMLKAGAEWDADGASAASVDPMVAAAESSSMGMGYVDA